MYDGVAPTATVAQYCLTIAERINPYTAEMKMSNHQFP
jgi:hypothetical protein